MKAVNPCGLKRAALINDLSCFGKCSLSVSMPILSSYGIETVPLPTALLSTHTGGFTGYVVQDTTEAMRAFAAHWKQVGSIAALPTRMSTPCGSCAVWRT